MNINNNHPAFKRLPKRLTISFPLFCLYDTPGDEACYTELDRFVREHAERSFNCIRIDDGAGLMHDRYGNRRGEVDLKTMVFGNYSKAMRQQGQILGNGGKCNLYERLIALCTAAKKYGVYIIISSWYYLHTFWFHPQGDVIGDELFAIAPHERFMAFAKFLDYILIELESKKLDDTIAFAEIFNEADGLSFINGYGNANNLSDEELALFKKEHEDAISYLQNKHPQILFAFDSYTSWTDKRQIPANINVYNFHDYYLWGIYDEVINTHKELMKGIITADDVRKTRTGQRPAADDWYERVAIYNDIDITKIKDFEKHLEDQLVLNFEKYLTRVDENIDYLKNTAAKLPDVKLVCGEGVSYIGSKLLLWEEKSDTYWKLVENVMAKYKEFGLWGTVIRTCCGPEDPCWNMCADKLRYLNEQFLR